MKIVLGMVGMVRRAVSISERGHRPGISLLPYGTYRTGGYGAHNLRYRPTDAQAAFCTMDGMIKPHILFVDDNPNVLAAIHRILHSYRDEWTISFATSGNDALNFMSKNIVNVMVTDIAMPEMDGKKLIYRLHELFPDTIPIVLSGHWDIGTSLWELGAHVRFLSKPVYRDILVWALREAVADARLSVSTLLEIAPLPPNNLDSFSSDQENEASLSWLSLQKTD